MMTVMLAALVLSASDVSLQYDGSLKEALKTLAAKGSLNVVVIGEFNEHVQINLSDVSGEDALETIAESYGLEISKKNKVWVIKRAVETAAPTPTPPPLTFKVDVNTDGNGALQKQAESMQKAAEVSRAEAEKMREQSEKLRQKLETMRNASDGAKEQVREAIEAAREKAEESAEQAREQAQEAAELAREEAQEQAEAAREQAQDAAEAARDQADAERDRADAQREVAEAQAELARSRVSTGGPVTVEKGSRVDDAVAYGGPVIVEEDAVVQGDAVAFGGDVVLKKNAVVEGDAVSFGGQVVREEGSKVEGETVSMGGGGFGSTVARNVVKSKRASHHNDDSSASESSEGFGKGLAAFLMQFALLFGLGFALMIFAPQRVKALDATVREQPVVNGVAGFLALLAVIPIALLMAVTLIGIPVAILFCTAVVAVLPMGITVVANAIGSRLPTGKLRKTQALVLAMGTLVSLLVFNIPVLGVLAALVVASIGFGAIVRTRFGQPGRGMPVIDSFRTPSAV